MQTGSRQWQKKEFGEQSRTGGGTGRNTIDASVP